MAKLSSTRTQRASATGKKTCFVVSPLGDKDSEVRKLADKVMRHLIEKALDDAKWEVTRADKISEPGIITSQIVKKLVTSDLVIADLTSGNPNVFYELAFCHAHHRPVIQIIKSGERVPFDISDVRTVFYDLDPDALEAAQKGLVTFTNAILNKQFVSESPFSIAMAAHSAESTDNGSNKDQKFVEELQRISIRLQNLDGTVRQLSNLASHTGAVGALNGFGGGWSTYGAPPANNGISALSAFGSQPGTIPNQGVAQYLDPTYLNNKQF